MVERISSKISRDDFSGQLRARTTLRTTKEPSARTALESYLNGDKSPKTTNEVRRITKNSSQ